MSRIRTIKPDFFFNETLAELDEELQLPVRLAYVGLWCQCDREGRFEWRPKRLNAQIFPYQDIEFSRVLDALTTRGFLVKYASQGREYGWIPGFLEHQAVNNREKESELPGPHDDESEIIDISDTSTRQPRVNHASTTREARQQSGKEGKGKEGNGKGKEGGRASTRDSRPPRDGDPPTTAVIELPLNDGSEFSVTEEHVREWRELYPAVEVVQELRNMRGWLLSNRPRRKTRNGISRFVNRWLSKSQDSGGKGTVVAIGANSRQQRLEANNQAAVDRFVDSFDPPIEGECS